MRLMATVQKKAFVLSVPSTWRGQNSSRNTWLKARAKFTLMGLQQPRRKSEFYMCGSATVNIIIGYVMCGVKLSNHEAPFITLIGDNVYVAYRNNKGSGGGGGGGDSSDEADSEKDSRRKALDGRCCILAV